MVEFESEPLRKDCQDLSSLIEQLTIRSAPKKPSLETGCNLENLKPKATAVVEHSRIADSSGLEYVGVSHFTAQCKLRTKHGQFKDYILKLQRGSLILSRPRSSKQPLLVYPVLQLKCHLTTYQDCAGIVLTWLDEKSTRRIYFDSEQNLYDCLLQVGHYRQSKLDMLSQYAQLGVLGEGGFGKVILAQHKTSRAKVAIKLIDKHHLAQMYSRCRETPQEIQLLQEVTESKCRNTLQLIDCSEDQDTDIIVTQYMRGQSLLDYIIKQGAWLNERRTCEIIRQIAEGIQDLHNLKIVHRDIKLANILMVDNTFDSAVCIADFGSATKLRSLTDTLTWRIGTEGYIAPEIILGQPYSFGVDVWSLGCLMHCLLFASTPFEGKNQSRTQVEWKVCHQDFGLGADRVAACLSQECKDLLSSMLARDPADRVTIDQVIGHSWFK